MRFRTRGPSREARIVRHLAVAVTVVLLLAGCTTLGFGRPAPVTVDQVLAMSRAGQPAPEIVSKMRESGTVYRLTAGQLSKLHDEGVPDPVIDYMQETYLASVRQRQALDDWDDWTAVDGYWYGGLPYGWPGDWVGVPEEGRGDHDRD